jgi:signal transduction histidine kinase
MLDQLADPALLAAPLALTCASVVVAGRIRHARRRERLNRVMHELRRPLQALCLALPAPASVPQTSQLELALDALAELDREINGGAAVPEMRSTDVRAIVDQAVARWRPVAARSQRDIELVWSANGSRIVCVPAAVSRALDNLIVNALEHGVGPVRIEAGVRAGRLRLVVADSGRVEPRPAGRRDPRRGHGLRVVSEVAAQHGGRFAACRHRGGATAVLELPLA